MAFQNEIRAKLQACGELYGDTSELAAIEQLDKIKKQLLANDYVFIGYRGGIQEEARNLIRDGFPANPITISPSDPEDQIHAFKGRYVTPSLEFALRYSAGAEMETGADGKPQKGAVVQVFVPKDQLPNIKYFQNLDPSENPALRDDLQAEGLYAVTIEVLNHKHYGICGPEKSNGKDEMVIGPQLASQAIVLPTYIENLFVTDPKVGNVNYKHPEGLPKLDEHNEVAGSFKYIMVQGELKLSGSRTPLQVSPKELQALVFNRRYQLISAENPDKIITRSQARGANFGL